MNSIIQYHALQMIGTQRSGSNLLRVMLDQVPEIFGPHPPHVLVTFYPLLARYGNLEENRNFKTLIDDVCTLVELNPVPWDDEKIKREKVYDLCRKRTLLEIFIRINELKCEEHGKKIWCCKSMESVIHLDEYDKENFKPFIIYLYRDGRDVAVSFKKIMVGDKHIYHLAKKWKSEQELAINYIARLPPERYVAIRYEDLITEPKRFMKKLCEMIGVKYNDSILEYYRSEESKKTAESGKMWENVTKPIIKNNKQKYLKELTTEELKIFESVAGGMLQKLGYERNLNGQPLKFSNDTLKRFDEENMRLKQEAIANADPHDLLMRKAQNEFIKSLKVGLKEA